MGTTRVPRCAPVVGEEGKVSATTHAAAWAGSSKSGSGMTQKKRRSRKRCARKSRPWCSSDRRRRGGRSSGRPERRAPESDESSGSWLGSLVEISARRLLSWAGRPATRYPIVGGGGGQEYIPCRGTSLLDGAPGGVDALTDGRRPHGRGHRHLTRMRAQARVDSQYRRQGEALSGMVCPASRKRRSRLRRWAER